MSKCFKRNTNCNMLYLVPKKNSIKIYHFFMREYCYYSQNLPYCINWVANSNFFGNLASLAQGKQGSRRKMTTHFYNLDQKKNHSSPEWSFPGSQVPNSNGVFNESWIPNCHEFLWKWSSYKVLLACETFIFMLDNYSLNNVHKCSGIWVRCLFCSVAANQRGREQMVDLGHVQL